MAKLHQVPSLVVGGVVLACLLAQVQALCADEQPSGQYEVIIKLRDGTGTPLQGEGFLMKEGSGFPVSSSWINTDSTGQIALDVAEDNMPLSVVLRGEEFGWEIVPVPLHNQPHVIDVVPGPSQVVHLKLNAPKGKQLPKELLPAVFSVHTATPAWERNLEESDQIQDGQMQQFSCALVKDLGAGNYEFRVPIETEELWVLVNEPGFLRGAVSESLNPGTNNGQLQYDLPQPIQLEFNITPDESKPHDYNHVHGELFLWHNTCDWEILVDTFETEASSYDWRFDDLAPGVFMIDVYSRTDLGEDETAVYNYYGQVDESEDVDKQAAKEDSVKRYRVPIQSWDQETMDALARGPVRAIISVKDGNGNPVAGGTLKIIHQVIGFNKQVVCFTQTVPESGMIEATGLPRCGGSDADEEGYLIVMIDETVEQYLDPLIAGGEDLIEQTIYVPPMPGTEAPNITLRPLDGTSDFDLRSLRGQVVFLDFWTSWCGPCQEPMAENNDLMKKHTDWNGKASIIGASIDDDMSDIRSHVSERDWWHVKQAWCPTEGSGWSSDAATRYAVQGVPTCYLIDQEGKIRWTGHPMEIDVESEINKLLLEEKQRKEGGQITVETNE